MTLADMLFICPTSPTGLRWRVRRNNRTPARAAAGCIDTSDGYYAVKFNYRKLRAHRVVAVLCGILQDYDEDCIVDHIDGNPLNNNPTNLRRATVRDNTCNKVRHRAGHLVGAHRRESGRWASAISVGGRVRHLGTYASEIEANQAYLRALAEISCV